MHSIINAWFFGANVDVAMHKSQCFFNAREAGFLAALHMANNPVPGFKTGAGMDRCFLNEANDK